MENTSVAIQLDDVCLNYRTIIPFSLRRDLFRRKSSRVDVYEAVKHVSFSVYEGEIVGIVGKNGSGKSTLLRAIAGIFAPDSGQINLNGHSISLLSIGVGFQRQLSGRENIFLSGLLLGFSEKQIQEKLAEIIEFSELGDFIDKPVRTYSSGMYSKLAFSITAILETDIMLIDEVLSVGDSRFKRKSLKKMKQLISAKDRTVIIVSHNSATLLELCDRIVWMHDGVIREIGDTETVIDNYERFMEE